MARVENPIELFSFFAISDFIVLILSIVVFFKFFEKKKNTPYYISIYYIADIFLSGLAILIVYHIDSSIRIKSQIAQSDLLMDFIHAGVNGFIWIPYFLISKRVKRTFIK